ncbi:MAG: prepilin-type N-terminal cleavage/methylation domain-containing protein [Endozoicomonadaceae bacterium]|nr:prepilin-type N-terminal cleavage/methylation domain-containing protein [Endozoicomonadaceae bacterium]
MKVKLIGFTLVELMITIAIAAILLTIGAPSLNSLYEVTRAESSINKIQNLIKYSRSQSMSLNVTTILCPLAVNACGQNWHEGMSLRQDQNEILLFNQINSFHTSDIVKFSYSAMVITPDGRINFSNEANEKFNEAELVYCPGDAMNINSMGLIIQSSGVVTLSSDTVNCQ